MKSKQLSTPIFVFDDYIDFLGAWYRYNKRFGFTQREFMKRSGINAHAFFSDILARRKKLGRNHIPGFIKALELSGKEAEYFTLLVQKETTTDMKAKVALYQKLASIREKKLSAIIVSGTSEYFSSWKYPLIYEFIRSRKKVSSIEEIAHAFINLKISIPEIRKRLNKLCTWNLVVFDELSGEYSLVDQNQVVTYKEIPHTVVNDTKRALIESSIHALENLDKEKRHISMSIRGLSREGYQHFCRRIDELRQEFLAYTDAESCGPVYTLNVQLFPVMKGADRRSGGEDQK